MVAPGAVRVDEAVGQAELYWPGDGRRVSLGQATMQIVAQFAVPDSAVAVAQRIGGDAPGTGEKVRRAITSLVEAGVLCESRPSQPPAASRRTGLFGVPVTDLAGALNAGSDFVVVGAPHDYGATYRPGSRFAPEALRHASTTVFRDDDGHRGMYDAEQDKQVLEGVGVVDIGDLVGAPGRLGHDVLDGLDDTVSALAARGQLPVVLGGDHSIALRVIDGLTRHHPRLGVLHFDAHYDHGTVRTGARDGVHHGNFLDWVVGNPAVECVAQFGIRQLVAEKPPDSGKVMRWPGTTALTSTPAEIVAALPKDLVWHVTFDVDVLDPSVMPATGTLLPGGYGYRDAVNLLGGLADRLPVVGVDVVEFLPGTDEAPAVTVAGLLLRLMDRIATARKDSLVAAENPEEGNQ